MTLINLSTPVYDGAIHGISFFNGRLLSGDDLAAEQKANRDGRRLLGRAVGEGVAYGLEVTRPANIRPTDPFVTIHPGLAINSEGQALLLEHSVDVSLHHLETIANTLFTGFAVCGDKRTSITSPTTPSPFVGSGNRVYLLVISSAEVSIGRAPVSGLGNIDAGCNARYNVEGVLFKLIPLGVDATDYTPLHQLRNRVAIRCLQTPDIGRDPFGTAAQSQNLLDKLRVSSDPVVSLKPCDVPLAAVYLEESGRVRFIDTWSVRRRLAGPMQASRWEAWEGEPMRARGEARYLQFQDHIRDLMGAQQDEDFPVTPPADPIPTVPNEIIASQRFEMLPAVGILPIITTGSLSGFDWQTFFGALAPDRLDVTDSSMLPRLLHESFTHSPIQVNGTANGELRLYLIRENVAAVKADTTGRTQTALVFAHHTLPYAGVARFNEAHWAVGHYS